MSYNTVYQCANDKPFLDRVTGAAADEGADVPEDVMYKTRWAIAAADDIEAAYASALAAGNPNPGGDESVITDLMILSALQANMPAP